ncbi:MAG: hypothetical protein QG608_231 [Actinomycetota bacterium]|nr:hypothetical protein [Actinomycetota bacterium]
MRLRSPRRLPPPGDPCFTGNICGELPRGGRSVRDGSGGGGGGGAGGRPNPGPSSAPGPSSSSRRTPPAPWPPTGRHLRTRPGLRGWSPGAGGALPVPARILRRGDDTGSPAVFLCHREGVQIDHRGFLARCCALVPGAADHRETPLTARVLPALPGRGWADGTNLGSAALPPVHRTDPEVLPSPSPRLVEFPALAMRGSPGLHGFSRLCLPPTRLFLAPGGSSRSQCSRGALLGFDRPGVLRCSRFPLVLSGPSGPVNADRYTRFTDRRGRRRRRAQTFSSQNIYAQTRAVGQTRTVAQAVLRRGRVIP